MESGQQAMVRTGRMFRPKPYDESQIPAAEEDEWSFVGDVGRGDQPREKDPDGWLRNLVMSEEARSIERNLGID